MKVLFLSANPQSTGRLDLAKEAREIQEALKMAKLADKFKFVQWGAVRSRDLRRALLEETPDIVHFSGHGRGKAGLVIMDEANQEKPATGEALAELLSIFSKKIKCVVLNACYAEIQAQAIVQEIDYVIGMRETIKDDAAIAFSTGFYDGLGYEKNIEDAFKLGTNAIRWEQASFSDRTRQMIPVDLIEGEASESLPEHLKPILLKKAQKGNQETEKKVNNSDDTEISSKNLEKYRKRIKEYVVEGKLNPLATFQLGTLAQELKIDQVEANKIWQEELGEIEEAQKQKLEVENNQEITKSVQTQTSEVIGTNDRGEEVKREKIQSENFTEDLGNGVTLDMVYIPGGSFMMGSPEGEGSDDEKPQHQVTVQPFFMGKYQVTQKQWKAIASLPKVERDLKANPSGFKGDRRPVEQVSWDDAVEFCQRLSKKTGKKYCLPSEAKWEYACRAGTTTPFYFGETISREVVNCKRNLGMVIIGMFAGETTEVGSFPANAFGLYDMHGNVWEWCQDDWHKNYENAPTDDSAWLSGGSSIKVRRGGSWLDSPTFCRSAYRFINTRAYHLDPFGFRVVCVVPRQT